jgi:hypothetical protein
VIHRKLKYNSIQVAIATIKIMLRILPTPKYTRIEKRDRDREMIRPRRELAKIKEKVKRRQKNIRTKKSRIVPKEHGSIK